MRSRRIRIASFPVVRLALTGAFIVVAPIEASPPSLATQTCPVEGSTCPRTTGGWLLFRDSFRGMPDFWTLEVIVIDEISVCPHGVHLVFDVEERGDRHVAAPPRAVPALRGLG